MTEKVVGRLGSGDYFGELALLNNSERKATVRAVGETDVIHIEKECFNRILGPLHEILKRNSERYAKYETELDDISYSHADELSRLTVDGDDESDGEDQVAPSAFRRGRRKPVFVEPISMDEDWEPRCVEKTPADRDVVSAMLQGNIMFEHLDPSQLNIVIGAMEEVNKQDGEDIIVQGDDGDYFYMLQTGSAEVWVTSGDDAPINVHEYKSKDSFGELALLHGEPRAATVRAKGQCRLWALDRDTFRRILMKTTFAKQRTYESFLSGVEILKDLNQFERFRIADALQSEKFGDGEVIIKQGDQTNDRFYIIEKGNVVCTTM